MPDSDMTICVFDVRDLSLFILQEFVHASYSVSFANPPIHPYILASIQSLSTSLPFLSWLCFTTIKK